ncbi:hypothetical protein IFM89_002652, partial [Coptis chinensis]
DVHLRVFKWPSMEVILDENDAHTTVKDLSFSSDEKYLVSLGSGSSCSVWDVSSSKIVASLPKENALHPLGVNYFLVYSLIASKAIHVLMFALLLFSCFHMIEHLRCSCGSLACDSGQYPGVSDVALCFWI